MTQDAAGVRGVKQLESANMVRAHQREWFAENRKRVEQGEPFAICNGDDWEEGFNAMDIPVMCINYWHAIIGTKQMNPYYDKVLAEHGYPVTGFARAMASYMDKKPDVAPWGGYPKPAILIGGTKNDIEMKVLEYWARECECDFYPLDWCLDPVPEWAHPPPPLWWERMKEHWDEMIEPHRLAGRIEEEKALVNFIENRTNKRLTVPRLLRSLELLNEQMVYWGKARDLIAETVPCPVNARDQGGMYQAMWHRGSEKGRDLVKAYYEEVKYRVDKGTVACPNEQLRLSWSGDHAPIFETYIEEKYGAVIVAWAYFSYPIDSYYRRITYDNPMKTLAGHHMILFFQDPKLYLRDAKMAKCDGRIEVSMMPGVPSFTKPVFEQAGIPVCQLPRETLDAEVKSILDKFIGELLAKKGKHV